MDRVHYECTVTETNGWDLALVIQNSVKRKKKTHLARFLDPVRLQVCSVFESDFFFSVFSDAMAF